MNERQEKFCLAYVKSGNASQAYKEAGYVTKGAAARINASRLLTKDNIKKRIAELNENIKTSEIAKAEELQITLTRIMRGELKEEDDSPATLAIKLKAIDQLAKMQGLYLDRKEFINDTPTIIIDNVTR